MSKQIIYIDASSLKQSACLRLFYRNCIAGYKTRMESFNSSINYGTAFHLFLDSYYKGVPLKAAIEKATQFYEPFLEYIGESEYEFRTLTHLYNSLNKYVEMFSPPDRDGIVPVDTTSIEQKFALPFWQNNNYEIALAGIIDMGAMYYGQRCIVDHKTTSFRNKDKKEFFTPYEMDIQTMFYVWIDKKIHAREHYLPILINGIFLKKPTIESQKKGVFDGASFERSGLIEYSVEQMQDFETWLLAKLRVITDTLSSAHPDTLFELYDERSFCRQFGLCKYFHVCKNPVGMHREILNTAFERHTYNPLTWRE